MVVDSPTALASSRVLPRRRVHDRPARATPDDVVGRPILSYEEYHPYGTTAWWAEKSGIQVSRKRYRYTGKENDEETGLYYHGARYYAAWLGRWERPDPIGLGDGGNRFGYCSNNPIGRRDPNGMDDEPALDILQWHVNRGTNQFELEPSGRTAPVGDLATVTPINIYDPNPPDRGPNKDDVELVAANTWAGEPQFQVARYGNDLYIVDLERMGLVPYSTWAKERADYPLVMAIPGLASDVLAGGPSRAGEEIELGLAATGVGKVVGAGLGWAGRGLGLLDDSAAAASRVFPGFSEAESSVIREAQGIVGSAEFGAIRAAREAGESVTVNIGGRLVQYEPGLPASGMTMFGENGFLIGREAFSSAGELNKTVLHELYRLSTSQSSAGVGADLAAQETQAAFEFAERAARHLGN